MYPNLTPALLVMLGVVAGAGVFLVLRRPFLRRLALRQVSRRRTEAALVIAGSMLGTAIIVGSLIVGDTLNFSVKQAAYTNLGPIDEIVVSSTLARSRAVAQRLAPLREDPRVDGVLTAVGDQAAATIGAGAAMRAEPRATVFGMDLERAQGFGGGSGISGPTPGEGQVLINQDLAGALGAAPGDALTFYLYGRPVSATVARVIPTQGVAGVTIGAVARDAFVAPDVIVEAANAAGLAPHGFAFVSNAGDVEGGAPLTNQVTAKINELLGPLTTQGVAVQAPKQQVLDEARAVGDSLGSMFLFIGSFAIIAGVMLLVVIFAMLAEERKSELGMLRAIGMKRGHLVRSFVIEGTLYALVASAIGVVVGVGVGRAVVIVAARIFQGMSAAEGGLRLAFHVTAVTLVNGFAMGFLISFLTVVVTSFRISRINIIAAIRDLPTETGRKIRTRWVVAATIAATVCAALAVPSIADDQAVGSYLFPSLAILLLCPLLIRFAPIRAVLTGASIAVLAWTLLVPALRPGILEDASTAAYIVSGVLLTFSAVLLVSLHQRVVTAPLRPAASRSTSGGLAVRLGIAYPVARRFRTGAILVMYSLVVFTLVLMTVLGAMINSTVTTEVTNASGGFPVRVDFNAASPIEDPATALRAGPLADQVAAVVPASVGQVRVEDLGSFTQPIDAVLVGVGSGVVQDGMFPLLRRMPDFADDRAAWGAALTDARYVIVDPYLGLQGGGPQGTAFFPGDTFDLVDPGTGRTVRKTIAGVLRSATGFYGIGNTGFASPVIEGSATAQADLGQDARVAAAFLKLTPGTSDVAVGASLEAGFLGNGLAATSIREAVDRSMAATNGFMQLMQGFLALGLLVGIAGLGVMMVRAVRERRRSIGVLRALGFHASTVRWAFLTESSFVALEGVLIGTILAIVTSYLLFTNFAAFAQSITGFPVPWATVTVVVVVAALASVLVTLWPAKRASEIRPAVALRVE
jgi:putative ABC transport system permease protein